MEKIHELPLAKVRPNPHNPRRRFSGPDFDALVENIGAVGVLSPVLARPVKGKKITHEIVFGGRRYAACCKLAKKNGGLEKNTIPARVRELTDAEALDLMAIENLQRDDLTPLEEADQFSLYVKQFGSDCIEDLAHRVGCRPSYIRKRLLVKTLPKKILKAWDKGDLKIGHLEQLARLKDKKQIQEYFGDVVDYGWSVNDLRRRIMNSAPNLARAKFNLEKAGCNACQQSSAAQKSLFDIDSPDKACCLNPKCFKQKQNNHLLKYWKRSGNRRKFKTNGFRFQEDVDSGQVEVFSYRWDDPITPPDECRECNEFITIIDLDGGAYIGQACAGPSECFKKNKAKARKAPSGQGKGPGSQSGGTDDSDGPRVAWHGEHFREEFYKTALPAAIDAADAQGLPVARLALFCLVMEHGGIHAEMARKYSLTDAKGLKALEKDEWWSVDRVYAWSVIEEMPMATLIDATRDAARLAIMSSDYWAKIRRAVADHFGIDLSREWQPTEEYLQKKTKAELLAIIKKFDIVGRQPKPAADAGQDPARQLLAMVDSGADQKEIMEKFGFKGPAAMKQAYLAALADNNLEPRPSQANPKKMKKPELVNLFMAPGVDLAGVVPDEILAE
jgi:ParB family transcriptional regulator, chromosome partitioning protein